MAMENKKTPQLKQSIETIQNSVAESVRNIVESIPKFDFTPPTLSDDFMDAVKKLSKATFSDDFMATINGTSKLQIECKEKRESNFYYVKEELSYKYGARHYRDFDKWYKKFIMFNPSYYDLPFGYIMNTTDEVIQYTDPETNTTVKIIGVNSVAYELFAEYREKQHDAQKQGLVWSDADEMARMEKFIKDVSIEQPDQLQDPDESVKDKVIRELNNFEIEKHFMKKNDFPVFVKALSLHLSNEAYILPQPIEMRWGGIDKVAKAVYSAFRCTNGTSLSDDTKLFDLMRVLSYYRDKDNDKIILDMQRT